MVRKTLVEAADGVAVLTLDAGSHRRLDRRSRQAPTDEVLIDPRLEVLVVLPDVFCFLFPQLVQVAHVAVVAVLVAANHLAVAFLVGPVRRVHLILVLLSQVRQAAPAPTSAAGTVPTAAPTTATVVVPAHLTAGSNGSGTTVHQVGVAVHRVRQSTRPGSDLAGHRRRPIPLGVTTPKVGRRDVAAGNRRWGVRRSRVPRRLRPVGLSLGRRLHPRWHPADRRQDGGWGAASERTAFPPPRLPRETSISSRVLRPLRWCESGRITYAIHHPNRPPIYYRVVGLACPRLTAEAIYLLSAGGTVRRGRGTATIRWPPHIGVVDARRLVGGLPRGEHLQNRDAVLLRLALQVVL